MAGTMFMRVEEVAEEMNDEKEMTALSTSVGADDGQSLNASLAQTYYKLSTALETWIETNLK